MARTKVEQQRVENRFYPAMYAARAIPLGLAVGVVVWMTPTSTFMLLLLGVAVLAQIAGAIIRATYRLPGMIAGAVFGILCHGVTLAILNDEPGRRPAPPFVEWLTGLPVGWVTDPSLELTQAHQLSALGDGVVPPQAVALRTFLG